MTHFYTARVYAEHEYKLLCTGNYERWQDSTTNFTTSMRRVNCSGCLRKLMKKTEDNLKAMKLIYDVVSKAEKDENQTEANFGGDSGPGIIPSKDCASGVST